MCNQFTIEVLKDLTRLPEIYNLRVKAWESSPGSHIINYSKFPGGFKDEFDDESIHLVALDSKNEIVSACRLTIFTSLSNYPYINLPELDFLRNIKFGLIGRGVRKKDIKARKLQYQFVIKCIDICRQKGINYVTGHAYDINQYMQNLMIELGFKFLCKCGQQNYKEDQFSYEGKLFIIHL